MDEFVTAVVVDDHPFFRDGVVRGLTMSGRVKVVGEADGGRAGLEVIRAELPDVAVVDVQMPDLDGLEVVHAVVRDGLRTRVLLLSAVTESAIVFEALEAGAKGYLSKDSSREEVVSAVEQVAHGRTVVPPELTTGLVDQIRMRADSSAAVLSEREGAGAPRVRRKGKSIPQIASEYLAPSTVKTHTQRLYDKLGVAAPRRGRRGMRRVCWNDRRTRQLVGLPDTQLRDLLVEHAWRACACNRPARGALYRLRAAVVVTVRRRATRRRRSSWQPGTPPGRSGSS
ncbi:MAG: response regulator transcription factor [Candidatus Nanopelagicales bacterium]